MSGSTVTSSLSVTAADTVWQVAGVGDFNGDDKADILWRHISNGKNAMWFMNGATASDRQYITAVTDAAWRVAEVGDFNADGKADILWRNISSGKNAVWLMNGKTVSGNGYITQVSNTDWRVIPSGGVSLGASGTPDIRGKR